MSRTRGVATALSASLILLLLNSAYLAATASPTLFYFANVVLHMVLGCVLAASGAFLVAKFAPSNTGTAPAPAHSSPAKSTAN